MENDTYSILYRIRVLKYRERLKGVQLLLSNSKAGPGREVKQEQEEISRNHVPRLFLGSVYKATIRAIINLVKVAKLSDSNPGMPLPDLV